MSFSKKAQHFENAAVHGGFAPLADQANQISHMITTDPSDPPLTNSTSFAKESQPISPTCNPTPSVP